MRKENEVCPVCANKSGHVSKDGGDSWQCDLCMGTHDFEKRLA